MPITDYDDVTQYGLDPELLAEWHHVGEAYRSLREEIDRMLTKRNGS